MSDTLNTSEATAKTITAAELFDSASSDAQKPAPETKASSETPAKGEETSEAQPEVEGSETHGDDQDQADGDDKSQDSDESEDQDESDGESTKGEKQTGFGKRISKLVKQKQALKQELEFYRQQVLAAQSSQGQKTQSSEAAQTTEAAPHPDNFDTFEEYQSALIQFNVKNALNPALDEIKKTITGSKDKPAQDAATESFNKKIKAFAKERPDYQEAIKSLNGIQVDKSVEQAIMQSEHGPALLYELGKNPDRAEEIAELPMALQLKEIGRLEAKIEARAEARKTPKTTKAPPPPNPVGSKSEGKKSVDDPSLSFMEYMKLRDEEEKRRRNDFL